MNEGAGNPFVKITYDKQRAKTEPVKASVDLSWKEFFLLYRPFRYMFHQYLVVIIF
jgi:hypothetical protein